MSLATPEKVRTLQRKLYRKAKAEPAFRFYLLYDKICRDDNVPVDDAPRHRPHQVLMRDRVEGRHDTLPTSRGRDSSGSFGHIIHLKGKRSKSSAASTGRVGCV